MCIPGVAYEDVRGIELLRGGRTPHSGFETMLSAQKQLRLAPSPGVLMTKAISIPDLTLQTLYGQEMKLSDRLLCLSLYVHQ